MPDLTSSSAERDPAIVAALDDTIRALTTLREAVLAPDSPAADPADAPADTAAEPESAAVTSPAPTDEDLPADAEADGDAIEVAVGDPLLPLLAGWAQYLALFVGAGMISGAVVHFTLAPARYAAIGVVGAVIFAVASVLSGREGRTAGQLGVYAGASLALALGIGMVAGSIQHFAEIPGQAPLLIPVGLLLSLVAWAVRQNLRPSNSDIAAVALWATMIFVFLFGGLTVLAKSTGGSAGKHGHDAEKSAPAHGDDHGKPTEDGHGAEDKHGKDEAGHGTEDKQAPDDAHGEESHDDGH